MPSLIYNSALTDEATGAIDYDSDAFRCMLVTGYAPDQQTHRHRSDVTGEVVGNGYTADGTDAVVSVAEDTVNNRTDITLGPVSWSAATIAATGAVYYKARGGVSTADELIAYIDFGGEVSSTSGLFSLSASTIRKQN
jgi:hypothetical protein